MKECNSCGKCCNKYSNGGLSASADDLSFWESLRPEDCRVYPIRVSDMFQDECEMLEPKDLVNLRLAQIKLDTKSLTS